MRRFLSPLVPMAVGGLAVPDRIRKISIDGSACGVIRGEMAPASVLVQVRHVADETGLERFVAEELQGGVSNESQTDDSASGEARSTEMATKLPDTAPVEAGKVNREENRLGRRVAARARKVSGSSRLVGGQRTEGAKARPEARSALRALKTFCSRAESA